MTTIMDHSDESLLPVTETAKTIIENLEQDHGDLVFVIAGGCCDGSSPLCFPAGEFRPGSSDHRLGEVVTTRAHEVYVSEPLSQHIKGRDDFLLDVVLGRGGGFSLEAPHGFRFINRRG